MLSTWIQSKKDEEGFTLIELLVVVIIIGILAAIAIPVFLNQRENAWRSAAQSDVRNAAIEVESFLTSTGAYPADDTEFQDELVGSTPPAVNPSNGVTLEYTLTGTNSYTITADHTRLDGDVNATYDSAQGGLVTP